MREIMNIAPEESQSSNMGLHGKVYFVLDFLRDSDLESFKKNVLRELKQIR